jgi:hypothetical protein
MSYMILIRNPSNGKVFIIKDNESDNAVLYESEREAEKAAINDIPICRWWPYSIVEAP